MSKMHACLTLTVIVTSSWWAGCSSSSPATGAMDSGTPDSKSDAGNDVTPPVDSGPEAIVPFDAGPLGADASPATGTLLQTGYGLVLDGVTSDGYVIYSNSGEVPTFYSVPLAGGMPVDLGLSGGYAFGTVAGAVAFIWNNIEVTTPTYQSPLVIWSSTGGLVTLTTNSFLLSPAASKDNQYVLYFDNFNATTTSGDLYVAKVDGTGKTLLQMAVPGLVPQGTCEPNIAFVGNTAVLAYCPDPATPTSANIATFTEAGPWTQTNILTGASSVGFRSDAANTNILVAMPTGLEVVPVAGGAATPIDGTGTGGVFTSTGTSVVYATSTNALASSPIAVPLPTILVASGVKGVFGLSPDDSTALVYDNDNMGLTDLYSASATTAGALTTLSGSAVTALPGSGIVSGDAFTADSSHILFFTQLTDSSLGTPYGELSSTPKGSSTATSLAGSSTTVWATTGAKILFDENLVFTASTTADIASVDLSGSAAPTVLVSAATSGSSAAFYLSPSKDKIVFSWTALGTETGGIYTAPVP